MNPILNTALRAAHRAGQMTVRVSGSLEAVRIGGKALNDFVSNVDRESEMILVDALKEVYPHHRIIYEESGSHSKSNAEYERIIGPLGGTTDFLHGHPQYAISMALLHKGALQEALVYTPGRNDLHMASRGQDALLNDHHIRVSSRVELNCCPIGVGFPVVNQSMMDKHLATLKDSLSKTVGGRREGSATLDLCSMAVGRLDDFLELNLRPWDVTASTLVVKEADGIVTNMQDNNTRLQADNIAAGNPKVLAQMLQIISAHN